MSHGIVSETRADRTERGRELIARHRKTKDLYNPGSEMARRWGEVRKGDFSASKGIVDTIISANILPTSSPTGDIPVLVSLSSNVGINEKVLADRFGDSYRVVAGDIQRKRLPSKADPMMFDASFLPFRQNSIAAMVDFQGAIWYEAYEDLTSGFNKGTKAENLFDIFERLSVPLQEGGLIIVDEAQFFPLSAIGTGVKIDSLLRQTGRKIEGFEVSIIGDHNRRLRVYKKVSKT